jgi:hypothetical protein
MSRAQDRSAGQSGAQAAQQTTGAQAPQQATGAQPPQQATGNVTGTSGNVTGATSTSLRDQPATRTESSTTYARSTGTSPGRRASGGGDSDMGRGGMGGVLSMLAGLLAFFYGLALVVRTSFYPSLPGYAYRWTLHGWGWTLLVLGALLFAAGAISLLGMSFGRILGAGLAVLTAIAGFLALAYSPIWGILIVALSVVAIWGLLHRDAGADANGGYGAGAGGSYGERYGEGSMGTDSGTMGSGTTTTSSPSMGTRAPRR